jgi:hypothetical protein
VSERITVEGYDLATDRAYHPTTHAGCSSWRPVGSGSLTSRRRDDREPGPDRWSRPAPGSAARACGLHRGREVRRTVPVAGRRHRRRREPRSRRRPAWCTPTHSAHGSWRSPEEPAEGLDELVAGEDAIAAWFAARLRTYRVRGGAGRVTEPTAFAIRQAASATSSNLRAAQRWQSSEWTPTNPAGSSRVGHRSSCALQCDHCQASARGHALDPAGTHALRRRGYSTPAAPKGCCCRAGRRSDGAAPAPSAHVPRIRTELGCGSSSTRCRALLADGLARRGRRAVMLDHRRRRDTARRLIPDLTVSSIERSLAAGRPGTADHPHIVLGRTTGASWVSTALELATRFSVSTDPGVLVPSSAPHGRPPPPPSTTSSPSSPRRGRPCRRPRSTWGAPAPSAP